MTKVFTVKNYFFFCLHQESTKQFLMNVQLLHVEQMNADRWDEGVKFSTKFSSSSKKCVEADEQYPVGFFFNYFFLCISGKAITSHYADSDH